MTLSSVRPARIEHETRAARAELPTAVEPPDASPRQRPAEAPPADRTGEAEVALLFRDGSQPQAELSSPSAGSNPYVGKGDSHGPYCNCENAHRAGKSLFA